MALTHSQADSVADVLYTRPEGSWRDWTPGHWYEMVGVIHQYLLDCDQDRIPTARDRGFISWPNSPGHLPGGLPAAVPLWWSTDTYDFLVVYFCADGYVYTFRDGHDDLMLGSGRPRQVGRVRWEAAQRTIAVTQRIEEVTWDSLQRAHVAHDVWTLAMQRGVVYDMVRRLRRLAWCEYALVTAPSAISVSGEAITVTWRRGAVVERKFVYRRDHTLTTTYYLRREADFVGPAALAADGASWVDGYDQREEGCLHVSDWIARKASTLRGELAGLEEAQDSIAADRGPGLLPLDVVADIHAATQTPRTTEAKPKAAPRTKKKPTPQGDVLPRRINISGEAT